MINKNMLLTAILSQFVNSAMCVSHAELAVMDKNEMSGIGELQTFRYRFIAHGSIVPISWGRLPDKIDR